MLLYADIIPDCRRHLQRPPCICGGPLCRFVYILLLLLVMEQADSCERHNHTVFVTGVNDIVITNGTARLCHVFDTALVRSLDIVTKREECV